MISPKPLPRKIQTPKKPPQSSKRMTIVFGILQSDSIVFAADTEETGEFMKISTPKLYSYERPNGECVVIGGAGSSFSVETIQQRLGKSFLADSASFEEIGETIIKQFHGEQVTIDPNRDFWLLIGASFRTKEGGYAHRLWISEHGSLRDTDGVAAIGIGTEIARPLLKKYAIRSNLPITELSSIHIMRLVKEQAHYCGKESMVWTLRGPDLFKMPGRHMTKAEELSRRYDELSRNIFSALFASEASLPYIDSKMRMLRDDYVKLLDELKIEQASEMQINEHFRNNPEDA